MFILCQLKYHLIIRLIAVRVTVCLRSKCNPKTNLGYDCIVDSMAQSCYRMSIYRLCRVLIYIVATIFCLHNLGLVSTLFNKITLMYITRLRKSKSIDHQRNIHVVFSTSCTYYQNWQSIVLFYSAITVGQIGPITRIASGCTPSEQKSLMELYSLIFPSYFIHFTPDFNQELSNRFNMKYSYYNKAFGLLHWLRNSTVSIPNDTVIAFIDPDFLFLRPLHVYSVDDSSILIKDSIKFNYSKYQRWNSIGASYAIGTAWTNDHPPPGYPDLNFNRTDICGPGSLCLNVTPDEATRSYRLISVQTFAF